MKKKIFTLLLASVVLLATACNNANADNSDTAKDKEKLTFVLDWTPNTNHTGIYAAEKLGYYDEVGIDLEIVQPPQGDAVALIAAGNAELGISFQDTLTPAFLSTSNLPVTSIAAVIQHNTSGIISLKGKGLASPKGLEGKTYATWDLPIEKAMMKHIVEKDGGDFSKVNLVPSTVTDVVSALQTNIDAVWVFYAWDGIATKVKGLETDYYHFKDIDAIFDYYSPVIVANNDFLKNKPDLAKKFLSATKKGYEYAIENPLEAADILLEGAEGLDEAFVKESQKWLANQYKAEVEQWGYIDAKRWDGFYNWLYENELIAEKLPAGKGFTNDYLPS